MSQPDLEEAAPVPDYELEQYFPERHDLSEADQERLRDQHGYVRTWFLMNPDRFRQLQRWLNQARMGHTYDIYLTKVVLYTVVAAVIGLLVGGTLAVALSAGGIWAGLGLSAGPVTTLLNSLIVVGTVGLFAGGTLMAGYYYPWFRKDTRKRNIDVMLPHAIVYMYALSHGGMNTFEVMEELAEADEVYGAVSDEFDMIVRDVELFGNDLFAALRDARNLTPSENLEQFLDDTISVVDSGSDFSAFLEDEAETYMEEAREEQENFLSTLSILSEIYIVVFVAAPLFVIVMLLMVTLLGGGAIAMAQFIIYLCLPLAMLLFILFVDVLSAPYAQHDFDLEIEDIDTDREWSRLLKSEQKYQEYESRKRKQARREMLGRPIQYIKAQDPLLSLAVSVPLSLVALVVVVATGAVPLSVAGLLDAPIRSTTLLFVLPFLVATVPLMVLYERERRREQKINERFPDTLNILSSANQMGIPLVEALNLVSRWSEGVLGKELRMVRNDIRWNHDVERSLLKFANRLDVPQVTRTMKLLAKGNHASSDLSKIISIAAEDTRNRYEIERKRRNEMNAYMAIVIIGFLVYLAVVVLLDVSYLTPISEELTGTEEVSTEAGAGGFGDVQEVPVDLFRTVFFHSALIQGIGSGLLAGKLAENSIVSGLKYSVGLVAVTVAVFMLI
ncbi:type IV pilus biogenesis complex membrane subunit [Natronomonas pharaonis DSM 2160]|uniref:Type IV pilus biogenesis complex membrane subunit n=1 Tax=Natronomonas pharaonis (strain ATCC 35678 / DSM 2160 / CIP 103997 / JCM 8858 / NBRC 14720 / NCIMB 2260 / Gabara) TaxID=348780 RepID=A0A1U7EWS2_NATPD|nr:type II secretion system F family protein [Natronomonas pharaonis]CAI49546.1 type IV pilus biogenesis complex membrane subunit [Natronomonas pharaonis DSM 2160]